MKINLFYSWQVTTLEKYNKDFIHTCLLEATGQLKETPEFSGIDFTIIDSVREEPGSPPVSGTIADRLIPTCDIFIADFSVGNFLAPEIREQVEKLTGKKHKPFLNNNVLWENGIAYRSLGPERIICLLNKTYGSPTIEPENLPFDVRHLRFPIEYEYSADNEEQLAAIQAALVAELFRTIRLTTLYALQHRKSLYAPLVGWQQWEEQIDPTVGFYRNEAIDLLDQQLKQAIQAGASSIRLLGLSGLGKTRILLELFRPALPSSEPTVTFSSRVLYLDCNHQPESVHAELRDKLVTGGEERIVVLDNCPAEIHRAWLPVVHKARNQLFLITIDSNPEEFHKSRIDGVEYLMLSKFDLSTVVDELLAAETTLVGPENVPKIKEFAQGIPLMAVLIVNGLKSGEQFVGKLNDKALLDKLLGVKGQDVRWRVILRTYALFSYLGVEGELRSQVEFVATNEAITALDGKPAVLLREFDEVRVHYLKREIFEQRGRLVGLRPFPLALYLAQEWLEVCPSAQLAQVLDELGRRPEPDGRQLTAALAEQMRHLGYDDRALVIVEKLVGPGGPFDNAKVLNTEPGSRLFRSFVEVNPIAVADNLWRQLAAVPKAELLALDKGRRNLVWVLEKLCFDRRTFAIGSRLLYTFAIAENETWANNATGQLLQLFGILLAGTEANLTERWQVIEWGLARQQEEYDALALRAMRAGLAFGHFSRFNGAETQGGKTLVDYEPEEVEITQYWTRIIEQLQDFAIHKPAYAEQASRILLDSLRGICRAGRAHLLLPTLELLAGQRHFDWPEALRALQQTRRFEQATLPAADLASLDRLLHQLDKSHASFLNSYLGLQTAIYLSEEENPGARHREQIIRLANEFINQGLDWAGNLPALYQQPQPYSYYFGQRLYQLTRTDETLVEKFVALSLASLRGEEPARRDRALLAGFLAEAPHPFRSAFYQRLLNDAELRCQLFYFVATDAAGKQYLPLLHQLVTAGSCSVGEFAALKYSDWLEQLPASQLTELAEQLFVYEKEGYALVLDVYFSLAYRHEELRPALLPVLETSVCGLGIAPVIAGRHEAYQGMLAISWLLQDGIRHKFAQAVNRAFIAAISLENSYHLDNNVQRIYELLLQKHFTAVWPELGAALLGQQEEYIKFYGLKHILGSGIGRTSRSVGVLMAGDMKAIFAWCRANQPLAPARLAELVPVFADQEYSGPSYSHPAEPEIETEAKQPRLKDWHPAARRLLDEFGELPGVLSGLSINLGNYSWTGSLVPLLKARHRLFHALLDHPLQAVAAWARLNVQQLAVEIAGEQTRDDEPYY
ncbi:hypothetical protein [Hymenobacter defluvii]|uniref:ATP-binding protein n=1 Tax=Hymenobacter defluvii TaxID=2054411 RepID=A0ABS3THL2_9BACT|nr:hypothetical protein [Hymenobacter defluvii]MBO3273155.1 hypothetical protein [Hymenobacter defluvii]